jgi:hypothetical protein
MMPLKIICKLVKWVAFPCTLFGGKFIIIGIQLNVKFFKGVHRISLMTLSCDISIFWVMTPCRLVHSTNIMGKLAASIFRVEQEALDEFTRSPACSVESVLKQNL